MPTQVREVFRQIGGEIACVIVEPVAGNMNCVPPAPGFLETLRGECDRSRRGADFRRSHDRLSRRARRRAGALRHPPDLTTLGKIIGGGMPVGAFGGRRDIMERLAPLGPVYQAGTLSGNPVAMIAGLTTLDLLSAPGFHRTARGRDRLLDAAAGRVRRRAPASRSRPITSAACSDSSSPPNPSSTATQGDGLRRRTLQALLPRHAGRRRLPRAVGLRGRFHLVGAHRRRYRRHHRGGAPRVFACLSLSNARLRLVRRRAASHRLIGACSRLSRLRAHLHLRELCPFIVSPAASPCWCWPRYWCGCACT